MRREEYACPNGCSLPPRKKEHELFARHIQNNTEIEGMLFTPQKDIVGFDNIDALISTYNRKLYLPKHEHRKLMTFHDFVYIKGYADDSAFIIQKITRSGKQVE